jgi:hypothetical protein
MNAHESRGSGLRPQRLPSEWEKRPLNLTQESPQGAAKTSRPTSRDLGVHSTDTASAAPGNFTDMVMRGRPGLAGEARAQAPIPGEVITVMEQAPGSFVTQTVAGGSFDAERSLPGDDGNVSMNAGFPGPGGPMVTKDGIKGGHLKKGAI